MREIKAIIIEEVKRIHEKAMIEPLSMEDLKRLESLTKSWRAYYGSEIDTSKEDLGEFSVKELREMASE